MPNDFESVGHGKPPVLFPLGEAYEWGREMSHRVKDAMHGGPMSFPEDMAVLCQMVYNAGGGDYVEIGSGFGFSAVMAALTMEKFKLPGTVTCVDPMDATGIRPADEPTKKELGKMAEYFEENMTKFGVSKRVTLVKSLSYPWPLKGTYQTAFIDGDHTYESVSKDWFSLKDNVKKYVMFHDYGWHYTGMVMAAWRFPFSNPNWLPVHISSIVLVMENLKQRTLI